MSDLNPFTPVHPGEILLEDYLKPLGLSQNQLALSMRVPAQQISAIINCTRSITPETALRLSMVIGTTPEFWLALQGGYDLQVLEAKKGAQIKNEVRPIHVKIHV
jgi:addiction module HigA family antidote